MTGVKRVPTINVGIIIMTGCVGLGAAAAVFTFAKLAGFIHWSWLAVLAPLWVPLALLVAVVILLLIFFGKAEAAGENPFL